MINRRKFIKAMGIGVGTVLLPAVGIRAVKKPVYNDTVNVRMPEYPNVRGTNFIIHDDKYIICSFDVLDWYRDDWKQGDTISMDNKLYVIAEVFDNCLKLYKG